MKFQATYQSGETKISTRYYPSRQEAVDALADNMRRHGIEPGVLHLPGEVSGDSGDCVPRAGGLMCVLATVARSAQTAAGTAAPAGAREVAMSRAENHRSLAEAISARYDDDGQVWTDADGIRLTEALVAAGATVEPEERGISGTPTRYTLPDGSIITTAGDAWDYGYPDCWCWKGGGHHDACEGR